MIKNLKALLLAVLLVLVLGIGGAGNAQVTSDPQGVIQLAYEITSTTTPQDITANPGSADVVVIRDLMVSSDTATRIRITTGVSDTLVASCYIPAQGIGYFMDVRGSVVSQTLQISTDATAGLAVFGHYTIQ